MSMFQKVLGGFFGSKKNGNEDGHGSENDDEYHSGKEEEANDKDNEEEDENEANNADAEANAKKSRELKGVGHITMSENEFDFCLIDNKYKVRKSDFPTTEIRKGDKFNFTAIKSLETEGNWLVNELSPFVSAEELKRRENRKIQVFKGRIIRPSDVRNGNSGNSFYAYDFNEVLVQINSEILKIQKSHESFKEFNFKFLPGDWLDIKLEFSEVPGGEGAGSGYITGKVISFKPSNLKIWIGKVVSERNGGFSIDGTTFYTIQEVKDANYTPQVHHMVKVTAIDSEQQNFQFRAVSIEKYKTNEDEEEGAEKEEDWLEDEERQIQPNTHIRLMQNKNGITIEPKNKIQFDALKYGCKLSKPAVITNCGETRITLKNIDIQGDQTVCKFTLIDLIPEAEDYIAKIEPKSSISIMISCEPQYTGRTKDLIIFEFEECKIGRLLSVTALSDKEEELKKIGRNENEMSHAKKLKKEELLRRMSRGEGRLTVRGTSAVRQAFFSVNKIPSSPIPGKIKAFFHNRDDNALLCAFPTLGHEHLSYENYMDKFHISIWLEEFQNELRRRQYDMEQVTLKKISKDRYEFEAVGIRDFQPPVLVNERVIVLMDDDESTRYEASIDQIKDDIVRIRVNENFIINKDTFVSIQFILGRRTYKLSHYAIDTAHRYLGIDWLFPTQIIIKAPKVNYYEDSTSERPKIINLFESRKKNTLPALSSEALASSSSSKKKKREEEEEEDKPLDIRMKSIRRPYALENEQGEDIVHDANLIWFNKNLNEEQKNAVRRVLKGQARPLPYIIFGPPGTGKTVTMVEAILQAFHLDQLSRILVVAPSNSAADILTENLVRSSEFKIGQLVRLIGYHYARRSDQNVPDIIADYCKDGEHIEQIIRNRLIITTCTTAGQLLELNKEAFFFNYVFIDEAGNCTEAEALISAIMVIKDQGGQIILAGDPMQLGPVLLDDAKMNVLPVSLLERLMLTSDLYLRDETRPEKYNPVVLTKLVRNYRTHAKLLCIPSRLFYDDELVPDAPKEDVTILSTTLKFLPVNGIPLIFHGTQGKNSRDYDSPSWYNKAEIVEVARYVKNLLNEGITTGEIGIITPYRKQVEKIREFLRMDMMQDEIPKVGSVEEFQGSERQVIIISTVRSSYEDCDIEAQRDRLAFIFDPKRFNVAITRARSLLIIVGNPHVLNVDHCWKKLLEYCIDNKVYIGTNLPEDLKNYKISPKGENANVKTKKAEVNINGGVEVDVEALEELFENGVAIQDVTKKNIVVKAISNGVVEDLDLEVEEEEEEGVGEFV